MTRQGQSRKTKPPKEFHGGKSSLAPLPRGGVGEGSWRWKRIGVSIVISLAANAALWLAYGHAVRKDAEQPQPGGVSWQKLHGEKIGFYTPEPPAHIRHSVLSAKEGGPHEQE